MEALGERLGLAGFVRQMPAGLDSPAGKNGSQLSGGQRQLVWFLRIAYRLTSDGGMPSAYLLLDEPTAAMDAVAAEALMGAVRILVEEGSARGAVIVTHRGDE